MSVFSALVYFKQKFGTPAVPPYQRTTGQFDKLTKDTLVRSQFYVHCRPVLNQLVTPEPQTSTAVRCVTVRKYDTTQFLLKRTVRLYGRLRAFCEGTGTALGTLFECAY